LSRAAVTSSYPLRATTLHVNGSPFLVTLEPRETLAFVLRERLGLLGTKVSCDQQVCGTCTVLLDGLPISSCTTLAVDVEDHAVVTIEGIGRGELHPVQRELLSGNAIQCGFCTPGFVVAAASLLATTPSPSRQQVSEWLGGNICRCTGYVAIIDAVIRASLSPAIVDPGIGAADDGE
jgi:carbon-monoxide dehydrogenase small subunit